MSYLKRNRLRILVGLLLVIAVSLCRFPWLECDAGNPGLWDFGIFVNDEGEYTGGGRLAYLTGNFLDKELLEPLLFSVSPGMHFLSYISYCIFGLHFGTARFPTILISVIGWFSAYWITSRYTIPILAGITTFVISCNPLSLTYERICNTNAIVGSLVMLTVCLVTRQSLLLNVIGGIILGIAFSVKITTLLLCPLIFLLIIARRELLVKRLIAFFISLFCVLSILYWLRNHFYVSDPEHIVPKFSIWNFISFNWFKAISNFPRWDVSITMGVILIMILILPSYCLILSFYQRQRLFTSKNILCLGILIFIISTSLGIYTNLSEIKRTNLMACLIIPTIILYLF